MIIPVKIIIIYTGSDKDPKYYLPKGDELEMILLAPDTLLHPR